MVSHGQSREGGVMLTRLIYASEASEPLQASGIEDMLRTARAKNRLRDITGLLLFDHRCFLQALEGDRQHLSDLYGSLVRDPRHRRLLLLQCVPVDERQFTDWSMGFAPADAVHQRLLLRHTASSQFDPYRLTASTAWSLLLAVAQGAMVQDAMAQADGPALHAA
jgi:Sensors of blue-light using FAD